jgi:DNA-binding transcriptional LysR family regulator
VDVRVLNYFLAVAKEGNITKAAEALHITQPTLSRQLIDLENELGVQLFIRGKRSVTLSAGGIMFQQRALEIVALFDKTQRDIAEQNGVISGVVSIGCVETSASYLLPEAVEEFGKLHPKVKYDIYSAYGDDIREKLDSGHLDIGVLVKPIETAKYDSIPLPFEDRLGLLMRADDPLASKESVTLDEVVKLPLTMSRRRILNEEMESWFAETGKEPNIVAYHNLLTNSLLLIARGLVYTLTVEGAFAIRPTAGIRFVPLSPERKFNHVLVWKKNKIFAPAATMFLEYVKDKYNQ